MFVIKDNVYVGYSCGRIVLSTGDHTEHLPIKYLSEGSSILLCSLLTNNHDNNLIKKLFKDNADFSFQQQKLIEDLRPYLIETTSQKENRVSFDKLWKSKSRAGENPSNFRLDYPIKLVVIPTWKCNRTCTYCGVPKISPNDFEEQLDPQLLIERIIDAVDNGVQEIVFHGGEPIFFYEQILDHIHQLRLRNVKIQISTKNHISKELARRLAIAGISKIQLSIDTVDSELCQLLYGDKEYANKLADSVSNLLSESIQPRINVVLSTLNYRGIVNLLTFLDSLQVSEVEISNYRCGSINELNLNLNKQECAWLHRAIVKNQTKWNIKHLIFGDFIENARNAEERPVCESARFGIVILPDGRTCYCDFLCENTDFCFGNIKSALIGQIWNDSDLIKKAFPSKDMFDSDSKCRTCSSLKQCIDRGICYVKAGGNFDRDYKCNECF